MPSREQVKAALNARVLALAQFVAPDGKVHGGREWIGHTVTGAKVGVVLHGPKVGFWQNFHSGDAGKSGLTLIRDCVCGGDFKAAWQWAHDFIGEAMERPPPAAPTESTPSPRERGEHDKSKATWLHARPFAWDEPVGLYLQGRGIEPRYFASRFGALRYHPSLWCDEAQRHMPAMVAAIIDPLTGLHIGLHRTYLERNAADHWRKASLAVPKKVIGSSLGGVIPLTKGEGRRPISKPAEGESALLAEGIENALTVAQWAPRRRALAYIAAGNLANLQLPPQLTDLMLVRDRDGIAPAIDRARDRAVARWAIEEGRAVSRWQPPRGFKDANDWWNSGETSNAA